MLVTLEGSDMVTCLAGWSLVSGFLSVCWCGSSRGAQEWIFTWDVNYVTQDIQTQSLTPACSRNGLLCRFQWENAEHVGSPSVKRRAE